jgi:hypothetical protein
MFWQHARTFVQHMLVLVSSPLKHGVTFGIFFSQKTPL